jgi:phosphoribosylaminoimidazole-succinocarboxamide synthase
MLAWTSSSTIALLCSHFSVANFKLSLSIIRNATHTRRLRYPFPQNNIWVAALTGRTNLPALSTNFFLCPEYELTFFQRGDTVNVMPTALLQTDLGSLPLTAHGKVRDIYAISKDQLLFVASDRISAFDHILGSGIPDKGKILTQLSCFWFEFLRSTVPNHLITDDIRKFPLELQLFASQLEGRSMIVKRAKMFPVEYVVRGYRWKDYQQTGSICGIKLPSGLRESDALPEPIFTPAAKINTGGHDENISYQIVEQTIGAAHAKALRALTLDIYDKATKHASSKGLILADTKFEFGLIDDTIILADEVLTPDSSRYWPAATYRPGGPQPSFDKQYVRDYLESIHWNKQAPAPSLPDEVVIRTREKYREAFRLITGEKDISHT